MFVMKFAKLITGLKEKVSKQTCHHGRRRTSNVGRL